MIDLSYELFTFKNISLYLLNMGVLPVSQEGEERKVDWFIQINKMYENFINRLAKTRSI